GMRDATVTGVQTCALPIFEPALVFRDADDDPVAVPGDRDVVGVAAQAHFLDDFAGLAIHDVQRAVGLVADVYARAVGSEVDPVGRLDALDHLHDLVGRRIDDVNAVAGAVGRIDADLAR